MDEKWITKPAVRNTALASMAGFVVLGMIYSEEQKEIDNSKTYVLSERCGNYFFMAPTDDKTHATHYFVENTYPGRADFVFGHAFRHQQVKTMNEWKSYSHLEIKPINDTARAVFDNMKRDQQQKRAQLLQNMKIKEME